MTMPLSEIRTRLDEILIKEKLNESDAAQIWTLEENYNSYNNSDFSSDRLRKGYEDRLYLAHLKRVENGF
jgi:hypothetical protein